VVYLAHDEELNREVALKEIRPEYAGRAGSRARFLLEAEINGRLEHPGIVPVYSLGSYEDGRPYCAMRLIEGTTLKEAIEQFHRGPGRNPGERSMAFRKLLERFRAVCDALSYAHSRGVLHRDVKPHNIIVGRYGETLLVDWGLAKVASRPDALPEMRPLRRAGPEESGVTVAGSPLGTPAYMSPEQANGQLDRLGPPTDVYGLGATLYHLLTGRAAFAGSAKDVLDKVRRGEFPPPRSIRRDVPRALEAICLKAMRLSPEGRFATVDVLADDLERWLADEPVSAYREPFVVRVRRRARRHRTLVIAGTAAVLLTATALGVCVLMWCAHIMSG
jgi:serine/threonine-protein kinase